MGTGWKKSKEFFYAPEDVEDYGGRWGRFVVEGN